MDNRRNYYRILHVQPDAPAEIIRMSYLTLMQRLKMHPDLGGDTAQAALINEAFATLMDPARRAAYDRTLARDRAMPGYRADSAHHGGATPEVSPTAAPSPHACAFCGTRFAVADASRVDARCTFCHSPIYPAAHYEGQTSARRAIERRERRMPLTYYLSWPQHSGYTAVTEDISTSGLRMACALDLVPSERLKIDCALCSAVAVVRHAAIDEATGLWQVGVEFLTLWIRPVRGVFVSTQV